MADVSVIIIGAGAAGLAAARRLHDAGVSCMILEARGRIGGRIWTDRSFAAAPIEHGAELVHGEGAATVGLAAAAGLTLGQVDRYGGLRWAEGGPALPLGELAPETRATILALRSAYAGLAAYPADAPDQSLGAYLRARGFDAPALAMADVLLAQTCCASIETLSCADLARELRADHAGLDEFRVREGYDSLLAWYARGLRVVAGAAARVVAWGPAGVSVTADGGQYSAERCIITLPVGVLQAGAVRFDPPLGPARRRAIAAFRVEPATKLFYRLGEPLWDAGLAYMAHGGLVSRWWTPAYPEHTDGLICAYVTAERARQIDAMPEEEALRRGLEELALLLGRPELARRPVAGRRISWAADPLARGGYAHVPPGAAWARLDLAAPEGGRLFFAGEATAHDTNPQTVHGAIESGWRAADEVLGRG